MLTQYELKSVLLYDEFSGEFKNKNSNTIVGKIDDEGYLKIRVFGKRYRAHRLAWLYVYGVWPFSDLDHKNSNRIDNRIENLREVDKKGNNENRRACNKNSKSGYLGVSWAKNMNKWVAQICHNKKVVKIGYYENPEEAHFAYIQKKRELHICSTL